MSPKSQLVQDQLKSKQFRNLNKSWLRLRLRRRPSSECAINNTPKRFQSEILKIKSLSSALPSVKDPCTAWLKFSTRIQTVLYQWMNFILRLKLITADARKKAHSITTPSLCLIKTDVCSSSFNLLSLAT